MDKVSGNDWKLYRKLLPKWQERSIYTNYLTVSVLWTVSLR